jgi:Tfp pilus assembly protein FimT
MKTNALTLVELIVGLAITSLIAITILVSFSLLDRRNLEVAVRNLIADLSWTRQAAMTRHYQYLAVINTTSETYSVWEDLNSNNVTDSGEQRLQNKLSVDLVNVVDDATNTTLTSPVQIKFTLPYGEVIGPSGTAGQDMNVNLTKGGRTKQVRIFATAAYFRIE